MLAGRIGGLRCGGPLFDWQRLRVEMLVISYHPPSHGRGMPEGQGGGRRRKRAKPTSGATRHLLPEEGGRSGENYLLPSRGRGMPEGQGVGRRRKRVKPTSGATRHLLPEEGGRNGMSNPSTPFPWKGDARRAGGWPKAKESEANLRRYAPPPSKGRREKRDE